MPWLGDTQPPDSVIPIAFRSATDPGAVGPGKHWYDTSDANNLRLWVRNADDTGWDFVHGTLKEIQVSLGNGVYGLTPGDKLIVPFSQAAEIIGWSMYTVVDAAPTVEIDLRVATATAWSASAGTSIVGATPPNLTAEDVNESFDVSDWTAAIPAGSILAIAVASSSGCTSATLVLYYKRTD